MTKILLVDDELNILKSLQRSLEDDFEVEIALGAEIATTLLARNSHDVILCDFMMPNMTGEDFYDYILKNHPELEKKLIFMTGAKESENVKTFFIENNILCLSKPFTHEELLIMIERISALNKSFLENDQSEHLQKTIIQSEKMSFLGQLSSGVAHEINNPLTYALNNMAVLKIKMNRFVNKEINLTEFINTINSIATETTEGLIRIKDIVAKLRDFSGAPQLKMELININECIEKAIDIVSSESNYQCIIKKNLSLLPMNLGAFTPLVMVFVNLLLNAVQSVEGNHEVYVTSKVIDEYILVSIEDKGDGIDSEDLPKLFTPFFTTKPVGSATGMGLAAAYGIVQLHQGKITVESEVNKGSIFTVKLPIKTM